MRRFRRVLLVVGVFVLGFAVGYLVKETTGPGVTAVEPVVDREYFPRAYQLIRNARKEILLLMFSVRPSDRGNGPIDSLLHAMIEAHRRGVKVRALIEGGEDFMEGDFKEKARRAYEILSQGGVPVRFDPTGITTHTKMLLVDDVVLVGSTNWSWYALRRNHEANALVRTPDDVAAFRAYFERIWATGVSPEGAQARASDTLLPENILAAPQAYDGQEVMVQGVVVDLRKQISRRGNPYTTFTLSGPSNGLRIYMPGHPPVREGQRVLVKGTYHHEKRVGGRIYRDEITARVVIPL